MKNVWTIARPNFSNIRKNITCRVHMLLFFLSRKYGRVGSYFVDKITKNIMVKINFKSDAWLIRY